MPDTQQSAAPLPTCPTLMSDGQPCARLIHPAPADVDSQPVCLMHSRDPNKDKALFREEIDAILNRTSPYHRPQDRFDFQKFIFPDANFLRATFTQNANFNGATFTQDANFNGATFTQNANFNDATFTQDANFLLATFTQKADFRGASFTQNANFHRATFTQNADFHGATFTEDANFDEATFTQNANFDGATFTQNAVFHRTGFGPKADARASGNSPAIADFRWAEFKHPEQVHFYQANQESRQGLRARLGNCLIAGVRFEDVSWHREGGRLVLQDELDRETPAFLGYEVVAIAYRRLSENCDKVRQYDLAEDCFIGAMEMNRLDPKNFVFGWWEPARKFYEKYQWARTLGGWVSVLNIYRLLSNYGSSYQRAFLVLVGLLFAFGAVFALVWLEPLFTGSSPRPITWNDIWRACKDGLFHSLEVATFQRQTLYANPTPLDRLIAMLENILVPAQLALLLLALRRRFRR